MIAKLAALFGAACVCVASMPFLMVPGAGGPDVAEAGPNACGDLGVILDTIRTVETGGKLMGSLLRAGVVDELLLYVAPLILGDTAQSLFALPEIASLDAALRPRIVDVRAIGPDVRITARF